MGNKCVFTGGHCCQGGAIKTRLKDVDHFLPDLNSFCGDIFHCPDTVVTSMFVFTLQVWMIRFLHFGLFLVFGGFRKKLSRN